MPQAPERRIITSIDVLVHPEYNRLGLSNEEPTTLGNQQRLRNLWFERGLWLASNPNAILIHHSYFLEYFPSDNRVRIRDGGRPDLWQLERERARQYQGLLGDRYLLYAGNYCATESQLKDTLASRNMHIDSAGVRVVAYGEYHNRCVDYWGGSVMRISADRDRWESDATVFNRPEHLSLRAVS